MSVGVARGYRYTGVILRTFMAGGTTPRFSIQFAKACPPSIHYTTCVFLFPRQEPIITLAEKVIPAMCVTPLQQQQPITRVPGDTSLQ